MYVRSVDTCIKTLWIGPPSKFLHLTINSFLHHGHNFHLYCYHPMGTNAEEKDANEIIPINLVFKKQLPGSTNSYSAFSNIFRYKLLLDTGGCWVDADTVCLKSYDFNRAFSSEGILAKPNVGVLMYDNKIFWKNLYNSALEISSNVSEWGQLGPSLLAEKLREKDMLSYVDSPNKFCPIDYSSFRLLFNELEFSDETYSVHLWNEMFKRWNISESESNRGWLRQMCYKYGVK